MTKLNSVQVMELINSDVNSAIEATENSFRNKCFVVLNGDRIEKFNKTKRSAESYIKKHSFSYYDEYFQEMREAGEGLYIVEIIALDIVDYYNTSEIWFTTVRSRWSKGLKYEYTLEQAEEMGVNEEVIKVIKFILENSDTRSFPSYEMVFGKPQQVEEVKNEVVATIEEVTESVEITKEINNNTEINENANITYKLNEEKNGIEIYFTDKPEEETRNLLKTNGFRWSKYNKCWYAKQSEETISLAKQLTNGSIQAETIDPLEIELLEFDNIEQYTISTELEKRLIDNSLISNKEVGYYTKDLQTTYNNKIEAVKQVLELANNNYECNKVIKLVNSYFKRHYNEYVSYLSQKSYNPSWAVTGRGGLNISRYNKKQDQLHNKLGKVIEISNKFDYYLNKIKNELIRTSKKKQLEIIQEAVNNTDITVSFQTSKREFEYYGYKYNTRCYESSNYFFMKMAACYRIFERSTGKEVHSMKTTDKLDDAKNYVMYLESELLKQAI